MPIFDTHTHYDDEQFNEDRDALIRSLPEHGIGTIMNVCASVRSLDRIVPMTRQYEHVYGAAGVHPDYADEITQEVLDKLRSILAEPKILAVGEIGLDYYWHKEEESHLLQQKTFRQQLDIAREMKMPFVIHSRDAAEDTLRIVKEYMKSGMYGGIMHCYSYSKELAKEYLDMGLYLGIGGVVTFNNARKLKEVVQMAPLSQLVLETDCPYLSPVPYRGKRNSSLNLPYVVRAIAELKGITTEEVVAVTEENAMRLLRNEEEITGFL